jgi:hypothetical protein
VNLNTRYEFFKKNLPGSLSSLLALLASVFQNLLGICKNIVKNDEEQKSKDYVLMKSKGIMNKGQQRKQLTGERNVERAKHEE